VFVKKKTSLKPFKHTYTIKNDSGTEACYNCGYQTCNFLAEQDNEDNALIRALISYYAKQAANRAAPKVKGMVYAITFPQPPKVPVCSKKCVNELVTKMQGEILTEITT
jgi:hypothetical protein